MWNDNDLKDWLLENGGPAIQLQINRDLPDQKLYGYIENAVSRLLKIEGVAAFLNCLDAFKTMQETKRRLNI